MDKQNCPELFSITNENKLGEHLVSSLIINVKGSLPLRSLKSWGHSKDYLVYVVARIIASQKCPCPVTLSCVLWLHVLLIHVLWIHSKKGLVDDIKLRTLRWGEIILDYPAGSSVKIQVIKSREPFLAVVSGKWGPARCDIAGFEDERMGPLDDKWGWPLEAGQGKK